MSVGLLRSKSRQLNLLISATNALIYHHCSPEGTLSL